MTHHRDGDTEKGLGRTPSGRELAGALIADLAAAPLPAEGIRETDGHAAAAYAVEAHRPPRARAATTEPLPVVVNLTPPPPAIAAEETTTTDPLWPPGTMQPTLVSAAGDGDAMATAVGAEQELVTVPRPMPRPRVAAGRTTSPSHRVQQRTRRAVVAGFVVGGLLMVGVGAWMAIGGAGEDARERGGANAEASATANVGAAANANVNANGRPNANPQAGATATATAGANASAAPSGNTEETVPRAQGGARPRGEENAGRKGPATVTTSKPTNSGPIEDPDRTF